MGGMARCGSRGFLALVVVVALGACGDDVDPVPDAPVVPPRDPVVLYLNFDGVTLSPGLSDAVANTTSLVTAPTTFPPYLDGVADRATKITAIVDMTRAILSAYNIDIVTARPAAGPYHMIVYSAPSETFGITNASGQSRTCERTTTGISLQYRASFIEGVTSTPTLATTWRSALTVSQLGRFYRIPYTSRVGDCMCAFATSCEGARNAQCVLNTIADVDHREAQGIGCPGDPNTVDVAAAFLAELGSRP